ncbi:hypothetical protein [Draconibacterium orientale]|uniref:hypothetical protein n=1 Tax=Draconibacterium orientale TaxID=1168034 RepID=UPI0029C0A3D3|nr:hypothetical protein [Draconibacterium orientale]
MKKLVFLFAIVFVSGIAMAQTTTVSQSNTNASEAGDNIADVSQTGSNFVKITQVQDIAGSPGGSATVTAVVEQSGTKDNQIKIEQTHNGTKNNGVSPLSVFAKQKGGKENSITQIQLAGGSNWGNVDFSAIQDGNRNVAYQRSYEDAGNDNGAITQKGNDNSATQKWHGKNYRDGNVNGELFIDQKGDDNTATQTFKVGQVFSSGLENRGVAQITQKGNGNTATQTQEGAGNAQYLVQNGNNNDASMAAIGNYNVADAKQVGNGASLSITQKQDYMGPASEGVVADGNSVMISQDGIGSVATILQDGLRNTVEGLGGDGTYAINNNGAILKVTQTGIDNVVQSKQLTGSETVSQMGMNNVAIVNQY